MIFPAKNSEKVACFGKVMPKKSLGSGFLRHGIYLTFADHRWSITYQIIEWFLACICFFYLVDLIQKLLGLIMFTTLS